MTIFQEYHRIKAQLIQLSKQVFEIMQANDMYQAFNFFNITHLDLNLNSEIPTEVIVTLFDSVNPSVGKIEFSISANSILELNESEIKEFWLQFSEKLMINLLKTMSKKFLTAYTSNEFDFIRGLMEAEENASSREQTIYVAIKYFLTKCKNNSVQSDSN